MAIGRRPEAPQQDMFVAASEIRAGGSPFYRALDRLLRENRFDGFAEEGLVAVLRGCGRSASLSGHLAASSGPPRTTGETNRQGRCGAPGMRAIRVAVRSSRGIERAAPNDGGDEPATVVNSRERRPPPGPSVTYVTQQYAQIALTVPVVTPAW